MQTSLIISPMTIDDLPEIRFLQPENWGDIIPNTRLYIEQDFCYPVKGVLNGQIVACGVVIVHSNAVWLANILVHRDHRNKGLGGIMTDFLVKHAQTFSDSVLLIATRLGHPVYIKLGFKDGEEYVFFKPQRIILPVSPDIIPYEDRFKDPIMQLDYDTTGEVREQLLIPRLHEAYIYLDQNVFKGFTIPSLGEGLTLATTEEAGIALMIRNLQEEKRTVVPVANKAAINFLMSNGFEVDEDLAAIKMHLGKPIPWKPLQQFGRVGGNMG